MTADPFAAALNAAADFRQAPQIFGISCKAEPCAQLESPVTGGNAGSVYPGFRTEFQNVLKREKTEAGL